MSLRSDYYSGATGLQSQMDNAFAAGASFVNVDNLAAISAALVNAAAMGQTTFTVTLPTTYNPTALRGNNGNNLICSSYLAGIKKGMSDQQIYEFEVEPVLNVSDTITTSIDLNFTFTP